MSTEAESIALALLVFGVYWGVVEWLRRRGTLREVQHNRLWSSFDD